MLGKILAAAGLVMAIGLSPVAAQEDPQPPSSQQFASAKAVKFGVLDGKAVSMRPAPIQVCEMDCNGALEIPTEMAKLSDQLVLPPSPVMPPIKPRSQRRNPIGRLFSDIGQLLGF